jgi:hypothetical protein
MKIGPEKFFANFFVDFLENYEKITSYFVGPKKAV